MRAGVGEIMTGIGLIIIWFYALDTEEKHRQWRRVKTKFTKADTTKSEVKDAKPQKKELGEKSVQDPNALRRRSKAKAGCSSSDNAVSSDQSPAMNASNKQACSSEDDLEAQRNARNKPIG